MWILRKKVFSFLSQHLDCMIHPLFVCYYSSAFHSAKMLWPTSSAWKCWTKQMYCRCTFCEGFFWVWCKGLVFLFCRFVFGVFLFVYFVLSVGWVFLWAISLEPVGKYRAVLCYICRNCWGMLKCQWTQAETTVSTKLKSGTLVSWINSLYFRGMLTLPKFLKELFQTEFQSSSVDFFH